MSTRRRYNPEGEIINYKRRIRRNRRRRRAFFFFVSTAIILTVIFRAPFFAINRIDITGTNVTTVAVREFANTLMGKNINWYSMSNIAETIEGIPYVRTARVTRHFPDFVRIHIEERIPFTQMEIDGTFFLIDRDGRVLEASREAFDGVIELIAVSEVAGDYFTDVGSIIFNNYIAIARAITDHDLFEEIQWVDLSDILNMRFQMGNILVRIGTAERLDYKFNRLIDIRAEIPSHIRGTLDIPEGRGNFREEFH